MARWTSMSLTADYSLRSARPTFSRRGSSRLPRLVLRSKRPPDRLSARISLPNESRSRLDIKSFNAAHPVGVKIVSEIIILAARADSSERLWQGRPLRSG
eukprot:6176590-Pleurochrysis_carterae.AAC.3